MIELRAREDDPDPLAELATRVFPAIVEGSPAAKSIRIWVPACATGEEAYAIAMRCVAYLESNQIDRQVQLFATDLSEAAVTIARQAEYPDAVARELGAGQLERFFTRTEGGWRVTPELRERCVFVRHDHAVDPPFSKLDLISCRNVRNELGPAALLGMVPVLHYALNQPGFLLLDSAENLDGCAALFAPVAPTVPIYARQRTAPRSVPQDADDRAALERQLLAIRKDLHAALAQNAVSVEELAAANEELQSMNEELLSMNGELQLAKGQLQTTNSVLESVNDELHRGNDQLRVLNDDLGNVLATVDIAIAIVDTAQRVRRFTPRAFALLNLMPSDVGRKITDLRPNVGIADLGGTIAQVIATFEMHEAEVSDAEGHVFRMQVRPYRSAGDTVSGAVISFVDISVLRRSLDEAQRARDAAAALERERDTFLNAVSHELRGPLNAILLWTALLQREEVEQAQRARGLATIEQSAHAEAQLIDDLLDLATARSADRRLAIHAEAIDPRPSVEAALDAVRAKAQAKQVELVAELATGLRVCADPRRLQQMTWHLVSNASKFTPSGGRVTVTLANGPAGVELVVADTGRGISAELLPLVFEPFHRADASTTRSQQGLGIGLSLVRHLAERQGGSVSVHSAGVGAGSTFTLVLPLAIA